MKKNKDINFEEGLSKLEKIVGDLEGRTLSLDEALKSFEDGLTLCQNLSQKLKEAEGKVQLLSQGPDGQPQKAAFNLEDNDDDLA